MPVDPDLAARLGQLADRRLAVADRQLADGYPGDRGGRQPVHTVYLPADRVDATTIEQWRDRALAALAAYDDDPAGLADLIGEPAEVMDFLLPRVRDKLRREPIEDLRIDFEDGLGKPDGLIEDLLAEAAARLAGDWAASGSTSSSVAAPGSSGIRFKSLERPTRRRGLRTLAAFVDGLAGQVEGSAGRGFEVWPVLTLPKVTSVDQVAAMVEICRGLEQHHGLAERTLEFELQIETTQAIIDSAGQIQVAPMIQAADRRCRGLHYGTYDYSAACGIAAEYQSMEHPAADFAKTVMQAAAAGTGVRLSDGSNNLLPVGDADQVRTAWALQARLVRRSLARGIYQGWDLHPAQLPIRFLVTYAFYRRGFEAAAARLSGYLAAQSDGDYLDEPATASALAGFVLRGLECGALERDEVESSTGADVELLAALARPRRGEPGGAPG